MDKRRKNPDTSTTSSALELHRRNNGTRKLEMERNLNPFELYILLT